MQLARDYQKEDYDAVREIVLPEALVFPERDDLGGTGVVVEEDGVIQGFAWALTSNDSKVAHIDYFVVRPEFRGEHTVGPALMIGLFVRLHGMGKKIFMGSLRKSNEFAVPLVRIYQNVGVNLTDELYFLSGNIDDVLAGLRGKYDKHN